MIIKDFVNLAQFTGPQLAGLIDRAIADKKLFAAGKLVPSLERKTLAMVFEKPSLRTRVSFEAAMTHLGGHAIYLTQADIGLGAREPAKDVARVLSRMCDGIVARTFRHEAVQELARHATVPVINALSDFSHPCQAMADMMTARELLGELKGRTLAFVGDGNNVARSLAEASSRLGMKMVLACPKGYELDDASIARLPNPQTVEITRDVKSAASRADVIYTDTWVSMGQEKERQKRLADLAGFQINAELLAVAPKHAIVMHCLPAYRGCEITDETFEAHASTIIQQAENRLHFQRTLLHVLMAEGGIK